MESRAITDILRYISDNPVSGMCVKVTVNRRVVNTVTDRKIMERVIDKVYQFKIRKIKETQRELYNGY